jgi:hypothetical protein
MSAWELAAIAGLAGAVIALGVSRAFGASVRVASLVAVAALLVFAGTAFSLRGALARQAETQKRLASELGKVRRTDRVSTLVDEENRAHPEVARWLAALPPADRFGASQQLSAQGLLTLTDEDLLRRAELIAKMLGAMDARACASMMRGVVTPDNLESGLAALSEDELREFAHIVAVGVVRQVAGVTHRQARGELVQSAIVDAYRDVPPAQLAAAAKTLDHLRIAADADVCAAGRKLYGSATKLPHDEAVALALGLAGS